MMPDGRIAPFLLAALIAPSMAARAADRGGPVEGGAATRVVLIGGDAAVPGLEKRIRGLMGGNRALTIEHAAELDANRMFRATPADTATVTTWISVDRGTCRLYVVDRARQRFLFRSLSVAAPLTEVDRERIGQVLKTAVLTVVEGGEGLLALGAAVPQSGLMPDPTPAVVEPATAVPTAAPAQVTAKAVEQAIDAPKALEVPEDLVPSPWSLGGLYEVQAFRTLIAQSIGIAGGYAWNKPNEYGVWLSLRYQLPYTWQSDNVDIAIGALSLRGGFAFLARPRLHLGFGLGVDRVAVLVAASRVPVTVTGVTGFEFVERLFARYGPVRFGGVYASATASLERVFNPARFVIGGWTAYYPPPVRPGIGVELWWR